MIKFNKELQYLAQLTISVIGTITHVLVILKGCDHVLCKAREFFERIDSILKPITCTNASGFKKAPMGDCCAVYPEIGELGDIGEEDNTVWITGFIALLFSEES